VSGQKVGLDVIGTSPLEVTERAVARLLVYVPPMPGELLGTSKASVALAIGAYSTRPRRPVVHVTTAAVTVLRGMGSYMPSGFVRLSLWYVSLLSDPWETWRRLPRSSASWVEAPTGRKNGGSAPKVLVRKLHRYDKTWSFPVCPGQLLRGLNQLSGHRAALG
jgi:hypothetical protein